MKRFVCLPSHECQTLRFALLFDDSYTSILDGYTLLIDIRQIAESYAVVL